MNANFFKLLSKIVKMKMMEMKPYWHALKGGKGQRGHVVPRSESTDPTIDITQ